MSGDGSAAHSAGALLLLNLRSKDSKPEAQGAPSRSNGAPSSGPSYSGGRSNGALAGCGLPLLLVLGVAALLWMVGILSPLLRVVGHFLGAFLEIFF
ncbi:hypothetical protein [Streptomyces decoyicus]|uniref:hypothetical protein n=1 Tax=Streptomyces decoyicus TaxID=249567 RepID=UPI0012373AAD|nr:hypothetical protein [Streptomyces decoyicus]